MAFGADRDREVPPPPALSCRLCKSSWIDLGHRPARHVPLTQAPAFHFTAFSTPRTALERTLKLLPHAPCTPSCPTQRWGTVARQAVAGGEFGKHPPPHSHPCGHTLTPFTKVQAPRGEDTYQGAAPGSHLTTTGLASAALSSFNYYLGTTQVVAHPWWCKKKCL